MKKMNMDFLSEIGKKENIPEEFIFTAENNIKKRRVLNMGKKYDIKTVYELDDDIRSGILKDDQLLIYIVNDIPVFLVGNGKQTIQQLIDRIDGQYKFENDEIPDRNAYFSYVYKTNDGNEVAKFKIGDGQNKWNNLNWQTSKTNELIEKENLLSNLKSITKIFKKMMRNNIYDKLQVFVKDNNFLISSHEITIKADSIYIDFIDKLYNDGIQDIINNNFIYTLYNETRKIPHITYDSDYKYIKCNIVILICLHGIQIKIEE